jgi:hypothetical protein
MLHFMPCEPFGHVGSIAFNIVHFCVHSSVPPKFAQTCVVHSVLVSLAVLQAAPNP